MSRPRPVLLLPGLGINVLIASRTFLAAKCARVGFPPLTPALLRFGFASAPPPSTAAAGAPTLCDPRPRDGGESSATEP